MSCNRSITIVVLACATVLLGNGVSSRAGTRPGTSTFATRPDTLILPSQLGNGSRAGACPTRAVFLRLQGEVRGYPLDASGATAPCMDIAGAKTHLRGNGLGYGGVTASRDGYLHATTFQSNAFHGGLLIFPPDANGDVPPWRDVALMDQDTVALGIDSKLTDYAVASQSYSTDFCWNIVPHGQRVARRQNCDTHVIGILALATDPSDDLLTVGFDVASDHDMRVDIWSNPSGHVPTLIGTIEGSKTGFPSSGQSTFPNDASLATDPVSGAIYVYISASVSSASRIEEFTARTNGNASPLRVITGSRTHLPPDGFAANVLSLDNRGLLYVSTQTPAILVFGPHARGNVAPERTIGDPHAPGQVNTVGVGVRIGR